MKILIAGEGGQGIQTTAKILSDIANMSGFDVVYMPHYGVEMRMGISFAYVQISNSSISYPKFNKADMLAVTAKRDLHLLKDFITDKTVIINCIDKISLLVDKKLSVKTLNMLCLGVIIKELEASGVKLPEQNVIEGIKINLAHKGGLEDNILAVKLGESLDQNEYNLPLDKVIQDKFMPVISQDDKKTHIRFPDQCKGCGICLEQCPTHALSWSSDKLNFISRPIPEVNLDKCIACGICEQVCPDCAIRVEKKRP